MQRQNVHVFSAWSALFSALYSEMWSLYLIFCLRCVRETPQYIRRLFFYSSAPDASNFLMKAIVQHMYAYKRLNPHIFLTYLAVI